MLVISSICLQSLFLLSIFFFFSSRRRHTRCLSDWSSDVCSSDLGDAFTATFTACVAAGRSPEDALRAAAINAASVVGQIDTQGGLLTRAAMDERLIAARNTLAVRVWSH